MLSRTEAIFDINLLKIQVYINWWKAYLNNVYFIKFEEKKKATLYSTSKAISTYDRWRKLLVPTMAFLYLSPLFGTTDSCASGTQRYN